MWRLLLIIHQHLLHTTPNRFGLEFAPKSPNRDKKEARQAMNKEDFMPIITTPWAAGKMK